MKLFLLFVVGLFVYGLYSPPRRKGQVWVVLGVGLAVSVGYFFLNQI